MNFEDIETDTEEKDLGVVFQENLKFSSHMAEKIKKLVVCYPSYSGLLTTLKKTPLYYSTRPWLGPIQSIGTQNGIPSQEKTLKFEKVQKHVRKLAKVERPYIYQKIEKI